jgi:RNA polymerase sigma-70 factor (ECF subfamily)
VQVATDPERVVQARFREMYEETLPVVYGFVMLRVGGNRALTEDITADTYAAAVKLYNAGRADEVTVSWLRTVARRRLIDRWRRDTVAADNVVKLVQPAAEPTDDHVRARVNAALAALTESQRQALVLQHIEGYSVTEVAELLGRTTKGTESLLARARAAFRGAFEEAEHD